jgi:hypothetical protein
MQEGILCREEETAVKKPSRKKLRNKPKTANFKKRFGCRWRQQLNRALEALGYTPRAIN